MIKPWLDLIRIPPVTPSHARAGGFRFAQPAPTGAAGEILLARKHTAAPAAGITTTGPLVRDVLHAPGNALDHAARAFMEPRFERDFSKVRVHSDTKAGESAASIHAAAYTVGNNIVFGPGRYSPETGPGRALLAHELAHTVQQASTNSVTTTQPLTISEPEGRAEKEAEGAASRIMAGETAMGPLSPGTLAIQRETTGTDTERKPAEKKDAGEVIAEGLQTVAEQAADNAKVKKVIIDPIKDQLKGEWDRLGTGEKAAAIGVGAAGVGIAGGAMLSNPAGRKQLAGVNLAAPLTLIPYMPLSRFTYALPTPDQPLLKLETSFTADDLINLRTAARGLPKMSLGVNLQWGYDPKSERLTILGGDATLGIVPGLSISGGAYKDILRTTPTLTGPDGQTAEMKKSIPEFGATKPIPDVRIMLNIDLLKFKPADLARQLKGLF